MQHQPKITILGAGVVGLSTALCIQESLPRAIVTLIADKFNEDTLSDGAGGLFRPELGITPDPVLGRTWYRDSYNHFLEMINSGDSNNIGCQLVSGFHVSSVSKECVWNAVLEELVPNLRELTSSELAYFPSEFKYGTFYTTVVADCHHYLPWMKQRFVSQGGLVECRHIDKVSQFAEVCDILVNCTGFGAAELVPDYKLAPIRGQTIRVQAHWIKHFYFGNENYVIPGQELVTLGGIKTYGSRNLDVDIHDRSYIWNGCVKLVPSLEHAKVVRDWVGLRPFRQPVRVEVETVHGLKIVHNYGHGGNGVSLSWGTAKHATHIVTQILKGYLTSHL